MVGHDNVITGKDVLYRRLCPSAALGYLEARYLGVTYDFWPILSDPVAFMITTMYLAVSHLPSGS